MFLRVVINDLELISFSDIFYHAYFTSLHISDNYLKVVPFNLINRQDWDGCLTCTSIINFIQDNKILAYILSVRICKVVASHTAVARSVPAEVATDLYFALEGQGVLLMRVGGATSQYDLPSLTPLSVAGCG